MIIDFQTKTILNETKLKLEIYNLLNNIGYIKKSWNLRNLSKNFNQIIIKSDSSNILYFKLCFNYYHYEYGQMVQSIGINIPEKYIIQSIRLLKLNKI